MRWDETTDQIVDVAIEPCLTDFRELQVENASHAVRAVSTLLVRVERFWANRDDVAMMASGQLVFLPHPVIFTRAAVASCAILREKNLEVPRFRIWVDASLAEYLWETLAEIVCELC